MADAAASAESLRQLADRLIEERRYREALAPLTALSELAPGRGIGHRLGCCHLALGNFDEAERILRQEVTRFPDLVNARNALGIALVHLGRREEALAAFRDAAALDANSLEAHNNVGNVLVELGRHEEAVPYFRRSIVLNPALAEAHHNLGLAYHHLRRYEEAIASFQAALVLDPKATYTLGNLVRDEIAICRWASLAPHLEALEQRLREQGAVEEPFTLIAVSTSPETQRRCNEAYARDKYSARPSPLAPRTPHRHPRIRLAYLSADFHEHATSHLIAGLLERHDRSAFEVTGISFGPDDGSALRHRVLAAFDRVVDVRALDDAAAAKAIRALEIDIAVDLKGYTKDARPAILAHRPAPLQVNYLGFPGTMGVEFIDYLVADAFVIPPEQHRFYAEKVVTLPGSYQVNDDRRPVAARAPTRAEAGLPDQAFVFCSFNNNFKITPEFFDAWMRLLGQVPGSVLWLLEDNPLARENLRREAQVRAIDPQRLVFAPRTGPAEHLARHRLADLFLDTLPYNAHTTASDALWTGLPVLTCPGNTFAGRVAGSLLHAVGLPELIARSLGEYESIALRFARDPEFTEEIRNRLARNRLASPLFDTDRFRRHIESAYRTMLEIAQRGEPPRAFSVAPLA